jgi:murein DD-endopeptidase MepM/ murein hydrolase activator NlpD
MLVPAASLATMSRGFFPGHAGMDLAAAHGSPGKAAASGPISFMGTDPDYGLFIDIRHPGGLLTRYGHLSAFAPGLLAGTAVRGGMEIGKVGATGNAQGAHLHFEVRNGGQAVDPKPFLTGAACSGAPAREELLEARAPDRRRQPSR